MNKTPDGAPARTDSPSAPDGTSRELWESPRLIPLDLGNAETMTFPGAADADLGPKPS